MTEFTKSYTFVKFIACQLDLNKVVSIDAQRVCVRERAAKGT